MEELIAELELQLSNKIAENELLEQMVNAGGNNAALEALQDENQKLREQIQDAKEVPKLKADLRRAQNEARALKAGNDSLNKKFKAVSAQLESLKQTSAGSATANAKVLKQAKDLARDGREAKMQLVKIYEENEELRSELKQASEDLQTMAEAFQLKDTAINAKEKELTETRDQLQDKDIRINELSRELEMQRKDMETLLEGISAAEDAERLAKEDALTASKRHETRVEALEQQLKNLESQKMEVESECARLKNDSAAGRTERELDELKTKLASADNEKEKMSNEIANVQEAFLNLGKDMLQLQEEHAAEIEKVRQTERDAAKNVYDTLEARQFDLEAERERITELETRNLQLETDLREADEWRAKYEQQWGLSEAVAYQNQLKNQLQIRDDQISKLNFDISAAQSNIQKMDMALRILRRECGKPEDWMPAGLLLEEDGLRSSREKWKKKTYELESQNDELEAQRLRLLQKLRQQAEMSAGPGTKFFGLTPDQCDIVFQYIEELREGGTDMPLNDKSRELKKRVDELEAEIGKLRKYGIKTASELSKGGVVHYHEAEVSSPAPVQQIITTASDVGNNQAVSTEVQSALMRLLEENSKLRRDVGRITEDLPFLVKELHTQQQSTPATSDSVLDQKETKDNQREEKEKLEALAALQQVQDERDELRDELQQALQKVDDTSEDAVIARWIKTRVAEFACQQAEEECKLIMDEVPLDMQGETNIDDSTTPNVLNETKTSQAGIQVSSTYQHGEATPEAENKVADDEHIAASSQIHGKHVLGGLQIVIELLSMPGVPDVYNNLKSELSDELERLKLLNGTGRPLRKLGIGSIEVKLLRSLKTAQKEQDDLRKRFQAFHAEQDERIRTAIKQAEDKMQLEAAALKTMLSGQTASNGSILTQRLAERKDGVAESYNEFMARHFYEQCVDAMAKATENLDDDQQQASADVQNAQFNLNIAEKRLAKATEERKSNDEFEKHEMADSQRNIETIQNRIVEAATSRNKLIEQYQSTLESGKIAASLTYGDKSKSNVTKPHARLSTEFNDAKFNAEPTTADGRKLVQSMEGLCEAPKGDAEQYILRYQDLHAAVSAPSITEPSQSKTKNMNNASMHNLYAHLIQCIEEVSKLNSSLAKVHKVLQFVEPKINNAAALQALLYHDHAQMSQNTSRDRKVLEKRCEQLEIENADLRSRTDVFDQYCGGNDAHGARRPMSITKFEDMSEENKNEVLKTFLHKEADLQLSKAKLTRRCRILKAAENLAKAEAEQLADEMREAQVVYKSRILFLELWRHGAMARIASLQQSMSVAVPKTTVDAFMEELSVVRDKYHNLLTEHSQLMLEVGVLRQAHLQKASNKLDSIQIEASAEVTKKPPSQTAGEKEKAESQAIKAEPSKSPTNKDTMSTPSESIATDVTASNENSQVNNETQPISLALKPDVVLRDDEVKATDVEKATNNFTNEALVQRDREILKLRGELKETRRNMRSLRKHCHILLEEARQSVDLQKKQAHEVINLRNARDKAESELAQLQQTTAGAASQSELLSAEAKVAAAQSLAEEATRDSLKHRGLLEIATSQADALALKQDTLKKEISLLREQVKELATASNDNLIIGKLQQELMAKTLTYTQFARKYKAAMVQLRAKELKNRELMKQLDVCNEDLHNIRQKAHVQVTAASKVLADLSGRMTGGLTLEQSEALSRHLKDLLLECTKQEHELERLRRRNEDSETRREEAVAGVEHAQREVDILRKRMFELSRGDHGGQTAEEAAARWAAVLVGLSDELKSFKLANLRHQRKIRALQEDKEHLRRRFRQHASSAKVLEAELVDKDDALRKQVLGLDSNVYSHTTNAGNVVVGRIRASNSAQAVQKALHSLLPNLAPHSGKSTVDEVVLAERDELDSQNKILASMQTKSNAQRKENHDDVSALLKQISRMRSDMQRETQQVVRLTEDLSRARLRIKLLEGQIAAEGVLPMADGFDNNAKGDFSRAAADARTKKLSKPLPLQPSDNNHELAVLPEDKHMQRAAQHTIKVLKKLLGQKNSSLRRYEQQLRAKRIEHNATRAKLEAEVARLQDLVDDRAISGAAEDIREATGLARRARGLDRRAKETAAKLETALRARVEEVEDLYEKQQKELYAAQDGLSETRRQLKAMEIKNGERLAENEILRARAIEMQHMSAQYPKMKSKLRKLESKLEKSKNKGRRLRAMIRNGELKQLEGSDYMSPTSKRSQKKKKAKARNVHHDEEGKQDDASSGADDSSDSSSDVGSNESDALLNDPVDGDSALADMVRKIRRRFNKKQDELTELKKQFQAVRDELVEATGDLEEARIAAKSAKERALDDAKAAFDKQAEDILDQHLKKERQLQQALDTVKKDLQNERSALSALGNNRANASQARTVGQLQQRNLLLKKQLDASKKKNASQEGEILKLREDVYIANKRIQTKKPTKKDTSVLNPSSEGQLAKENEILATQNKVLRQALADVSKKYEVKIKNVQRTATQKARELAEQASLKGTAHAAQQAQHTLLDAQQRIKARCHKTLSSRLRDKDVTVNRLRTALQDAKHQSTKLEQQLETFKENAEKNNSNSRALVNLENNDLKNRIEDLLRKNARLQDNAGVEVDSNRQLQRRVEKLRAELLDKDEKVFRLEKEIAKLERTIDNHKEFDDNKALLNGSDALTEELQKHRYEAIDELRQRHKAELRAIKSKFKRNEDDLRKAREELRKMHQKGAINDENFDTSALASQERLTHAERKLSHAAAEKTALVAGLEKMRKLLERQNHEISSLKGRPPSVLPGWIDDLISSKAVVSSTQRHTALDISASMPKHLQTKFQNAVDSARQAEQRVHMLETELRSMSRRLREQKRAMQQTDLTFASEMGNATSRSQMNESVDKLLQDKARLQGQLRSLEAEANRLREENKNVKAELSSFDASFFRDIEQLRERYINSVHRNKELERRLRDSRDHLHS